MLQKLLTDRFVLQGSNVPTFLEIQHDKKEMKVRLAFGVPFDKVIDPYWHFWHL